MIYGRNARLSKKMKGTCDRDANVPPWPETKFNRTIGKEENRRIMLD